MKRGEVLQVVAVVLLQFVGSLQQPKVLAQVTDVGGDPEYSTFGREEYSPYLNQNFPQRVFGGETHVLTACATDSGLFVTRLGPDEAYRFVKSEEVISQSPEGLCAWMARYEEKTGGQVFSLSHNGNLSNGLMLAVEDPDGKPATLGLSWAPTRPVLAQDATIAVGSTPNRLVRAEDVFIEGRANVPGVGTIDFEVEQGPQNPWNALFGVNLGLQQNFELALEYGLNFDDVSVFVVNATYRF